MLLYIGKQTRDAHQREKKERRREGTKGMRKRGVEDREEKKKKGSLFLL
jgi:hypothetical protein